MQRGFCSAVDNPNSGNVQIRQYNYSYYMLIDAEEDPPILSYPYCRESVSLTEPRCRESLPPQLCSTMYDVDEITAQLYCTSLYGDTIPQLSSTLYQDVTAQSYPYAECVTAQSYPYAEWDETCRDHDYSSIEHIDFDPHATKHLTSTPHKNHHHHHRVRFSGLRKFNFQLSCILMTRPGHDLHVRIYIWCDIMQTREMGHNYADL